MECMFGTYLVVVLALILCSCGSRAERRAAAELRDEKISADYPRAIPKEIGMPTFYQTLPVLSLPAVVDRNFIREPLPMLDLPESLYDFFKCDNYIAGGEKALRLPESDSLLFVLLFCFDNQGNEEVHLYSMTPDFRVIDFMKIYGNEPVYKSRDFIRTAAEIQSDYRVRRYSTLNGEMLLDQLFFAPGRDGKFSEVRDGNTPAMTYESFDGVNYTLERFVWKMDEFGTLYKSDVQTTIYNRNDDNGGDPFPEYVLP